ncbi:DNA mismatch repair protein Mlh3 isoform X1 [Leucoraja erinacea]|uniref:DNA mismatch repair protein Mlh3 isoform X1 n=1 Tax=Leucoraja erinaceus TaxID=7782 RepID=UPI0024564887|nr:DNA mismatch repair protein Mlh3 isoform X1 [Leucoraja erinacea]
MGEERRPVALHSLPGGVRALLRSAVTVPTLGRCLEELLLNSLAAGCGCAAARVHAQVGRVQVADNGAGLERAAAELAGARYHSGRAARPEAGPGHTQGPGVGPGAWAEAEPAVGPGAGQERGPAVAPGLWGGEGAGAWAGECAGPGGRESSGSWAEADVGPGCRGEALASIADLSSVLEIVSRPKGGGSQTWVKLFRDGQARPVYEAETPRPSPGTTVTVCGLFHRLPVRSRRMGQGLEWEQIRHRLQALSLLHPSVSFTVRNEASAAAAGSLVVRLPKASNVPARFAQIYGAQKAAALGPVQHSNGHFHMRGYICREGHHTKAQRLIFINGRLVLKTRVHKQLDLLIHRHSAICRAGPCIGTRAASDLHPVYIINISCGHSQYDACWETGRTLLEFTAWDLLLSCLEEGVRAFLSKHQLLLDPSEEQQTIQLPTLNPQPVFINERTAVQSKCVHRQAAVPDTSQEDAATVEKDGALDVEGEEPLGTAPHSTEAPRCHRHIAGQQTNVCGVSPCDSPLGKVSGCDSPETQRAEEQHSTQSVLAQGDGIQQLAAAYESETSSPGEGVQGAAGDTGGSQTGQGGVSGKQAHGKVQGVGVELCVTGLITHVIPKQMKAFELANTSSVDSDLFHPGPMSAWDTNERLNKGQRQLSSGGRALWSTTKKIPPQTRVNKGQEIPSSWQSHEVAESMITPGMGLAPESRSRDAASCVYAQARFHRKLSMPPITGSLDAFRREYAKGGGQDRGSSSQGTVLSHRDPNMTSRLVNVTGIKEAENVKQARCTDNTQTESLLHDQPGYDGFLTTLCSRDISLTAEHVPKVLPSNIAPPTHSQTKNLEPRTLAAKLSRLKHGQCEGEKNYEPTVGSLADCSPLCRSSWRLLQLGEESATCSPPEPIPSAATESEKGVGREECQESCTERESTLAVIHREPCPGTLSGAVTEVGTSTQTQLHIDDQAHSDGAVEANKVGDLVMRREESDATCIHPGALPDGAEVCVETCEGDAWEGLASEWLQYFDGSVGKTMYVNNATGVSCYDLPTEPQTRAACTKDFTTMAVNVLTKTGCPYRCYPFRSQVLLPFLPRPRDERHGASDGRDAVLGSSDSLRSMFLEWKNPVFLRAPEVAVDVGSVHMDSLAVKIHNILYPYRFTKDMIRSMQVLNQVDNKFIACLINTRLDKGTVGSNLLVLVDQHAAHERVRLEQLISDCYELVPGQCGRKRLTTSTVCPPMEIPCTPDEARLLRLHLDQLEVAGVELELGEAEDAGVFVKRVPACFVQREATEARRGRQPVTQTIVQEFLREQIEVLQTRGGAPAVLSRTMLKVLASQACHGAVKFGHGLSVDECRSLMGSLASCHLPFQCAHGRPSILPLADLDHLNHLDINHQVEHRPNLQKLWTAWTLWTGCKAVQ